MKKYHLGAERCMSITEEYMYYMGVLLTFGLRKE